MTRCSSTSAIASSRHIPKWLLAICAGLVLAAVLPAAPAGATVGVTAPAGTLPAVLDRVGKQVERFWNFFSAVTCTESLTQSKLDGKGKTLFEQRTVYDYLILLQSSGDEISVEESRIEKDRKARKGKASLLLTNGFSLLTLIFHPIYQSCYEFQELPEETVDGRKLLPIQFKHIPHDRTPSVLVLHEREYPLEWRGTAWIDPASYEVVRIEAGLGNSMEDIGLLQLDTVVNYTDVGFAGSASKYWLPTTAVIEAATRRQHWRNIHVFSDYRRFNVETEVKTGTPQ